MSCFCGGSGSVSWYVLPGRRRQSPCFCNLSGYATACPVYAVAAPRFADCIGVTISNMGRGDIMDSTIIIIIIIIIIQLLTRHVSVS